MTPSRNAASPATARAPFWQRLPLLPRVRDGSDVLTRVLSENFTRYRQRYAIAIACLIGSSLLTAYSAWLMGDIVNDVFYGSDWNAAVVLSLTVVAIFLIKGALTYGHTVVLNRVGNNIVARYQRRLFAHLLSLDVAFFGKQHSVSLVARIAGNVMGVRDMLNTLVLTYARDLVTLVCLVGVMVWRDPIMSATIFIAGPIAFAVLNRYARRVRSIARDEVTIGAQVAASMQEAAHGITVVKAMTMEEQLRARLDALTREVEERSNKIARITARTAPLMETLIGFAVAGVIAYGGYRVIHQGYPPGDLTSFMTALLLAYEPAKRLARLRVTLERSMVNARMIYEVLDTPSAPEAQGSGEPFELAAGAIRFDDVIFRYRTGQEVAGPDDAPVVIDGLTLHVPAGRTTALVGPSGGGKSTIFALLQRFYEPESGTITVDGRDVATIAVSELRAHIAYVSQHPVLFQGTVRDNLRYARPDATDAEVEAAARSAQAHDFITALADGYDTPLGENGANLSGGQRQRLSIARAIVRDAPILLLDEATSALDNESERLVQRALDELMRGRTTIVIAHRLSTIVGADSIAVVDGGRVVDQGTHDELMGRESGVYARLHGTSDAATKPAAKRPPARRRATQEGAGRAKGRR